MIDYKPGHNFILNTCVQCGQNPFNCFKTCQNTKPANGHYWSEHLGLIVCSICGICWSRNGNKKECSGPTSIVLRNESNI